ncbi:hypothetical protein KSP39_PZI013701 [Platanthera zijinensis]|uniref:Putative plant transposon protein domain-containing protein n=1 Tax=Platanthera zijinensis TaxID=2320716 RepID=A0AAP0BDM9_9ASPA
MAPKKGREKVVANKHTRFINEEAKARYELLKAKPIIYERGFQLEVRGWSQAYVRQIEKFGWNSLCHPRTEAVLPWVYEFYANAKFHMDGKIHIRGREVDFSAEGINSYFDLTNLDSDVFESVRTTNHSTSPPH